MPRKTQQGWISYKPGLQASFDQKIPQKYRQKLFEGETVKDFCFFFKTRTSLRTKIQKKNQVFEKNSFIEEKLNVWEVRFWQGYMFMLGRTEEFKLGKSCLNILMLL